MEGFVIGTIIAVGFLFFYVFQIVKEYERGILFTLGRFEKVVNPGLRIILPVLHQLVRVDMRTITMDVPPQDVISKDNVSVHVNAVLYFRIIDPEKVILQVEDYFAATSQLAQTTLRSVLGQHELDEMLSEREKLNQDLQDILDKQTDAWGIKVQTVELKHVDLTEGMVRAIARQAEAERERRAKVIHAEGELQASEKLLEAAKVISERSEALQLRYLQTLNDISSEAKSQLIIFPLPMELMKAFEKFGDKSE